MKNLNKELYTNEILTDWQNRSGLIHAERHLFSKYLVNSSSKVLKAGTGGGRLSYHIEEMGFDQITAFDLVPEMIDFAKEKTKKNHSKINFEVADATNLSNYPSNTFDYSIYLQQVLCFIANENDFLEALKESYRVTKVNGIVIYSFLDINARFYNTSLKNTLNILRLIRGEKRSKNLLPWMKINNKFNLKFLNKNQPLTYWVN